MSEVRGGGQEELPCVQGQCSREELPRVQGQGGSREELPYVRGQGR